ncbi:MAG: YezD family protein [Pseudomonadales bacterium]|jgi:hypothetical protein|nr:YezD family protein [Pseudomonadales bacterium]MCP5331923.1 YezD family protein [Pseudomonadales bacterium]HMU91234.1 DUF2292 domain-containing protein [Pseudomonadales bacterium]HMW16192.1 DUF2292 domain-containing protein [Pseudomonadales bacterium]HMW84280.1 DUF2292 domain-containing protein [Pseudomonadales bacterium]
MSNHTSERSGRRVGDADDAILAEIKRELDSIQFGSVEIQIHNGQVVQIERREKKRWQSERRTP